MQQSGGWTSSHTPIAISGTGYHALEKTKHALHARYAVQSCHKMHFRCTGIGKTRIHTAFQQSMNQTLRAIHA
jgi:hypothetical protein